MVKLGYKRIFEYTMIKVGVFFGGASREREVSFAGGRTVYDNLDKERFEAVPIFVDAYGNFVKLNWQFVYRGTIRDFFPPAKYIPEMNHHFQLYSESLDLSDKQYAEMLREIGTPMRIDEIAKEIDFAFLALHGSYGEDGSIQGMLEWFKIPYSGSGIMASALGVSKHIQKKWWNSGLALTEWKSIRRDLWEQSNKAELLSQLVDKLGLPFVAKSSNQGSSIGVQVIKEQDVVQFEKQVNAAFFVQHLNKTEWESKNKLKYIQELTDLRIGLGLPLLCNGKLIRHPEELLNYIEIQFNENVQVELQASAGEYEVVFEQFLEGREFSCIVVQQDNGKALALPPTEVVKGKEIFDYNSKYLPGLSHKQTPIQIEESKIDEIRKACVELFNYFEFEVYARIDGFVTEKGIYLNDPNTTSGMMPSSFFFHQAAEIGLNPKNFITYIIRTSIAERLRKQATNTKFKKLLSALDTSLEATQSKDNTKQRVAVLFGGYSTERHISVESGRNIYEKLASSVNYEPTPIFLTGKDGDHRLYKLPISVMLKDNADDIKSKIESGKRSKALEYIRQEAQALTQKYTQGNFSYSVEELSYNDLKTNFDSVFIALHGRPGEDGQVQAELDKIGLPYNGSGVESSMYTINKYQTNQLLREQGFLVADSLLVHKKDWLTNKETLIEEIKRFGYPLICKPHDEGCSSAVIKIENDMMLNAYADLCYGLKDRSGEIESILGIGPKDEFPSKDIFMVETFTSKGDAEHFLEITGGMLTHYKNGQLEYEVFEPSEALSTGTVLTLAEKFLAGEGQNITPARFSKNAEKQSVISQKVKQIFAGVAKAVNVEGYCRIDAFVRIYADNKVDVIIIEINSLPGMTPATCIYHQAAINNYKPDQFIDSILQFGVQRTSQIKAS